jgi:hypothetical protein
MCTYFWKKWYYIDQVNKYTQGLHYDTSNQPVYFEHQGVPDR